MSNGFPDGRDAALYGIVRAVPVKLGTYSTAVDWYVFDLDGQFGVLLGNGWHDAAEPQISWRHNQMQVLQGGVYIWHVQPCLAGPADR